MNAKEASDNLAQACRAYLEAHSEFADVAPEALEGSINRLDEALSDVFDLGRDGVHRLIYITNLVHDEFGVCLDRLTHLEKWGFRDGEMVSARLRIERSKY